MNTSTADNQRFACLCRRGALERVQIHAGHPLAVSGHVLDPDVGDLVLRLRSGVEGGRLPEFNSRAGRQEAGTRKWISVNGVEALFLPDDASPFSGFAELPEFKTDTSRELVNEAMQALSSIWDAAAAQVDSDRSRHIPIAESLNRLNRIAREEDPVGAWEKLIKDLLIRGRDLTGNISDLRLESARGIALPNHFHKVNVFLRFTPAGGLKPVEVTAIWRDAGEGTAALDVGLSDLPDTGRFDGRGSAGHSRVDRTRSKAIQRATEWLAALEHAAHEFVFSETIPVVQRIAEASHAGHSPCGPEFVWRRAEGARRSALAHLNQWVREVYP
jgi:hypothetical protein